MTIEIEVTLLKQLLEEVIHNSESTNKVIKAEQIRDFIDNGSELTLINNHIGNNDGN